MLGWSAVVDSAMDRLVAGSNDPLTVEMAGIGKSEAHEVGCLLEKLALRDPCNPDLSKRKWLYLNLLWLFENKSNIGDPLGAVEEVYANFDYPPEIAGFVRYMPPADGYDPSVHGSDENQTRMFDAWSEFLESDAGVVNQDEGTP